MDKKYPIGEVAKLTGSTVKTIRYYDEIGLLKPTAYTEGGHRLYSSDDIWRLELIATLRYLDFGIDEIHQLMAGELTVEKALAWQIESLEIQANTLVNMIAILRQAEAHGEDSLRYIHDLVNARTVNAENRRQFITDKVEEAHLFEGILSEWRDPLLYYFNKFVVDHPKTSAKQAAAWKELQELLNDPEFIADLKRVELLFLRIVQRPRYNAATWGNKLKHIQERLDSAWRNKCAADSKTVQSIVEDMALLYTNSDQLNPNEDFIQHYVEYFESTQTKPLERCNTLCAIISPQYHQLYKGNLLLYQGIQWRLGQNKRFM
ncbi:MerR family transcriptional regulator [Paenibacillus sp. 79R4]|uniref:MerR family transcriptional regulator n=1 Tax=Paenibacillus sp. 79R4 TaxID=2212847 RepID=UPI0021180A86|nr:MerR family transcriptional regulator [Paenibacillus sp. 79R4]